MEDLANKRRIPKIGLRKIKSLCSVCVAFIVWQIVRCIVPVELEVHPLFGYLYAIIEMRETPEKTKQFSAYRIKATLIGLTIGLSFLPISVYFAQHIPNVILLSLADLGLILLGVLVTLTAAEFFQCKNLCGIAAIIFAICMVRDKDAAVNIYVYAILRTVQTFVGVFAAWLVNTYFFKNRKGG